MQIKDKIYLGIGNKNDTNCAILLYNIVKLILRGGFMPTEAMIMMACAAVCFILVAVISIVSIKNFKQHVSHNIDGHFVEIIVRYSFVRLVIDNKVVDELHSYQMHSAKLQGLLDGKQILVNIGSGFLKPNIVTFIDGEKINELSNY